MLAPLTTISRPCKRGHTLGRDAKNYCRECSRLAGRARRAANAEKYRQQTKNRVKQTMLYDAKRRARKGGFACTITIADIIIPEFCPLLGIKLVRGNKVAGPASPSLDKIRPEIGYVPGNIWVISHRANIIKGNYALKELQLLVSNLSNVVRTYPWEV